MALHPLYEGTFAQHRPDDHCLCFRSSRREDIDCFQMDVNMSILEGGIGIFPRRLMVRTDDHKAALQVMQDNDIDLGY